MSSPVEAFESWFRELPFSQQVDIAVHLAYAVPALSVEIDQGVVGCVSSYLREPYRKPIELIAKLGGLKSLIDVCIAVPRFRNDVSAFAIGSLTVRKAKALALGDGTGADLADLAAKQGDKHQDSNA